MKLKYHVLFFAAFLCILFSFDINAHETSNSHKKEYDWDAWDVIPGEVLIKYTPQRSKTIKAKSAASGISGLTLKPIHEPIEREFKKKNPKKKFIALLPDTFIGYFDPLKREQVLQALAADPEVIYFEPNRRRVATPAWGTNTPNDPDFPFQWGMPRIGADQTWPRQLATPNVSPIRVAVMEADGPFDAGDPDLTPQLSAFQNDARAIDWHGTAVAGVVAATGNNTIDVVGVANIELVALDKGDTSENLAQAITTAVNNGVQVINMSWKWCGDDGLPDPCDRCVYTEPSNTEQDAISAASWRIVFVSSAGNDNCDFDPNGRRPLPMSYQGVIGVSAIDWIDNLAGFSNFGPYVDLTAPGDNIWTTNQCLVWNGTAWIWTNWCDGTSFAAPHVAGAAAAVLAIDNNFDTESINQLLELTAEDLPGRGRDDDFGCGVVRIDRAVNAIADNYVQLGSRDGDGTLAKPFETISDGVNNTPNNGTLGIVSGSYNTTTTISTPLTLIAVGGTLTIGSGTYYKTPTRNATGSDSLSISSGTWAQGPGLAGFYFDFLDENHHIDEIKIILNSTKVDAAFNDKNDDDEFRWFAAGHTLPSGTTYSNVSGSSSGGFAETSVLSGSGVFVLTGFRFDYNSDDHHLDEIGVEFFSDAAGTKARVFFNDDNDDDDFTYEVHYAVVPSSNVAAQGNISSAIVRYKDERICCLPGNAVIQNFRLNFSENDHQIDEIGVDLSPGRVWYNDRNDDDGFTWFVDWVEFQ